MHQPFEDEARRQRKSKCIYCSSEIHEWEAEGNVATDKNCSQSPYTCKIYGATDLTGGSRPSW